jgi:hypothetical protein
MTTNLCEPVTETVAEQPAVKKTTMLPVETFLADVLAKAKADYRAMLQAGQVAQDDPRGQNSLLLLAILGKKIEDVKEDREILRSLQAELDGIDEQLAKRNINALNAQHLEASKKCNEWLDKYKNHPQYREELNTPIPPDLPRKYVEKAFPLRFEYEGLFRNVKRIDDLIADHERLVKARNKILAETNLF